jgi:hypothetical protein
MATGPVLDPEMVARKVAAMSLGREKAREARSAAEYRFQHPGLEGGAEFEAGYSAH